MFGSPRPAHLRDPLRSRFFVGAWLWFFLATVAVPTVRAVDGWLMQGAVESDRAYEAFTYTALNDSATAPVAGDIFSFDASVQPAFWGNQSHPIAGALHWRSSPFRLNEPWLVVPILGPRAVTLALVTDDGDPPIHRGTAAAWTISSSAEMPALRVFDLSDLVGQRVRLEIVANDPTVSGWTGIGRPLAAPDLTAAQTVAHEAQAVYRNDLTYFKRSAAITLSLLGFALLAAASAPRSGAAFAMAIAVTILAWAAVGLAQWIGWTALAHGIAITLWWAGLAAGGIGAVVGCRRTIKGRTFIGPLVLGLYVIGVASAHFATVPDLPVLGESAQNYPLRARMVASPPDNIIPFCTAVYMYHGKNGREDRAVYFGAEWAITSRGPLLPLIISALFVARDHHPHDPVYPADRRWPADAEGMYIAPAAAIALNGLLLPAVIGLVLSLRPGRPDLAGLAGGVLTVSPFFNENMAFVWPKLMAATGVVLALQLIRSGRCRPWPGVLALAYLAHPLALLFSPALVTYEWIRGAGRTGRSLGFTIARRALPVLVLLLPWWIYKQWVDHPDVMLGYVFGDGHGFTRATSLGAWFMTRVDNAAHTFVPGYWWVTGHPFYWFDDWISGAARWSVFDGRTLWGQLGSLGGLALGWSLFRHRKTLRTELLGLMLPATVILLVFWGFSRDGLGRQCLEPLTAIVLALGASQLSFSRKTCLTLLVAGAAELIVLRWGSVSWDEIARPDFLWRADFLYLGGAGLLWLLVPGLWAAISGRSTAGQLAAPGKSNATDKPPA